MRQAAHWQHSSFSCRGGDLTNTHLCVVELCLHVQRLQNLIENRLQAEGCGFLTLHVCLAVKEWPSGDRYCSEILRRAGIAVSFTLAQTWDISQASPKPTRDLAAPGERRRAEKAHLEFEKLAEIELLPVLTRVTDRADEAGEKAGPPF